MPTPKRTRIQTENRERIRAAALEVFAQEGFRGATVDAIAERAGMSKPNLLYYFPSKDAIYRLVLERLLDDWLAPLRALDEAGDAVQEIAAYLDRKIEMARDFPAEGRLFTNEMLRGAPNMIDVLEGELRTLVNEKAKVIRAWIAAGKIRRIDPHHLIFAIWATTQHYADYDVQVRAVLGDDGEGRFHDGAEALRRIFLDGLRPR
ncbi:MAG: TetR family transcriptional regulator C-terminal domain-containing protein [Paracoccaceae bacterium]